MSTQLSEIRGQIIKLYELVDNLCKANDPAHQQFSLTFETTFEQTEVKRGAWPQIPETKGMRKHYREFFKGLQEKYAFDEFDANDDFVFDMAYKCRIADFREAMNNVSGDNSKGFIKIVRSGKRHKSYQFTKLFV